jgi:hypothetical protein
MKLDTAKLAEYASRYEILVNHDGTVVIDFYDKHGSLFDEVPLEEFLLDGGTQ